MSSYDVRIGASCFSPLFNGIELILGRCFDGMWSSVPSKEEEKYGSGSLD
jgi:hypothetical protein